MREIPSKKDVERAVKFADEWTERNENGDCSSAWIASQGDGIESLVTIYRYIGHLVEGTQIR